MLADSIVTHWFSFDGAPRPRWQKFRCFEGILRFCKPETSGVVMDTWCFENLAAYCKCFFFLHNICIDVHEYTYMYTESFTIWLDQPRIPWVLTSLWYPYSFRNYFVVRYLWCMISQTVQLPVCWLDSTGLVIQYRIFLQVIKRHGK